MDLKGFLYGSDGVPIEGATVRVYEAADGIPGTILYSTTTDANGMWEFTGLNPIAHDVRISYVVGGQEQVRWLKGNSKVVIAAVTVP